MLRTRFWKNAADSLPAELRARYLNDIEQAERWELALGRAIEGWTRAKDALARSFHTPRNAH